MIATQTSQDVLTVVKYLAGGRDIDFTARVTYLSESRVREIAETYGWPDRERLAIARDELERESQRTAVEALTIPASAPVPPRPTPTPTPTPATVRQPARQLVDVPIGKVVPDPDNPREDVGDVDDLARSMRSVGMLQPIVARLVDGRVVVVAGHRRLAAAQQLGWKQVPVVLRRDLRPDHVLVAMYVENSQRRDLDPIEEARALSAIRAQHRDCSVVQLAKIVGRSQPLVSARLALLALPVEEQEALRNGELNLGEAIAKARVAAGTARPAGYTGHWYLGADHALSDKARARCKRLHKRPRLIGATACGECWESVIRADERQHIHQHSARTGSCAICSSPYGSAERTTT